MEISKKLLPASNVDTVVNIQIRENHLSTSPYYNNYVIHKRDSFEPMCPYIANQMALLELFLVCLIIMLSIFVWYWYIQVQQSYFQVIGGTQTPLTYLNCQHCTKQLCFSSSLEQPCYIRNCMKFCFRLCNSICNRFDNNVNMHLS